LIFTGFLLTPAVLSYSNPQVDISCFFSITEEENKESLKIDIEKINPLPGRFIPEALLLTPSKKALTGWAPFFWELFPSETPLPPPRIIYS
jgi:hypothetical protein